MRSVNLPPTLSTWIWAEERGLNWMTSFFSISNCNSWLIPSILYSLTGWLVLINNESFSKTTYNSFSSNRTNKAPSLWRSDSLTVDSTIYQLFWIPSGWKQAMTDSKLWFLSLYDVSPLYSHNPNYNEFRGWFTVSAESCPNHRKTTLTMSKKNGSWMKLIFYHEK